MGYRLHWLNKYKNTWVPLCSEHTVDSVAGQVSTVLSAQVQGDLRFNPLSPAKCHEKLKSCEILHCNSISYCCNHRHPAMDMTQSFTTAYLCLYDVLWEASDETNIFDALQHVLNRQLDCFCRVEC